MRKLFCGLVAAALLTNAAPLLAGAPQANNSAQSADGLIVDAARAGDANAQWQLGVLIDEGKYPGTLDQAITLFRESAAQKNTDAIASLAVMYANGRGVPQDYAAAMRYYQLAARLGNAHALEGLGVLYANGQGVAADEKEAIAYWLVAAAAGDPSAMSLLNEKLTSIDPKSNAMLYDRANQIAEAYGILPRSASSPTALGN